MTIVYASDRNYAALTAISAVSALKHNPGAKIVLLGYNLEEDAHTLVRSRVEKAGGEFIYRDVSESLDELRTKGYSGYTSYAVYSRLFIADILASESRALYLDCDTLVCGSLDELFRMDMGGRPIAMGRDCIIAAYRKFIGLPQRASYYNSGVMLFDLPKWRERRCKERLLDELANPHGPNPLSDQDIIVRRLQKEIAPLAPKWNFLSQFFLFSHVGILRIMGCDEAEPFSEDEYLSARSSAAIYHFSGHTLGRPWYTCSRHPMREKYREAARDAGLADVAEQTRPMTMDYKVQYWMHRLFPQCAFDVACGWLYRINIWRTYRA